MSGAWFLAWLRMNELTVLFLLLLPPRLLLILYSSMVVLKKKVRVYSFVSFFFTA